MAILLLHFLMFLRIMLCVLVAMTALVAMIVPQSSLGLSPTHFLLVSIMFLLLLV
jgi:hypothetical protein